MSDASPGQERLRLVVIFGGVSAEHDVSCVSATNVLARVDRSRYEVVPVGITRAGEWVRADSIIELMARGDALPGEGVQAAGTSLEPGWLTRDVGERPAVAFPLVHGPHGEDGTLQGMLELAGLPYIGTGVLGSAICMDKSMAKTLTAAAGIPQAKAFNLTPGSGGIDALADRAEALMDYGAIGYPVFVKPAGMGSSVGITKAHDRSELIGALELALAYDERLVIEETVEGREIEVAVLGNPIGSRPPRASIPGEIVPAAEFYDFADKYTDGSATLLIPAELDDDEADAVRTLALEAYTTLRCDGLARVDFFYEPRGRGFLLNEINTIPGFTPTSMYPKLWEASGLGFDELVDELVRLACERHDRRSDFTVQA